MNLNRVPPAPPDAILGLTEAFKKDPRPEKINLGVGVFMDDTGRTPVLPTVKQAEEDLAREETSKSYLPIAGLPAFGERVADLVFGAGHEVVRSGRVRMAQSPGGTGALRIGAEFLRKFLPSSKAWLSAPTWPNHKGVFSAAGLPVADYPYYDPASRSLAFGKMAEALDSVPENDVVVLHVCCHNPTGADLSADQWREAAAIAARRRWIPFFDFAYQGFGAGLEADRAGLLPFLQAGLPVLVAASFSKNFGLYNERTGALALVAPDAAEAAAWLSHVQVLVRVLYSNPPAHGAAIAARILGDPLARADWEREVDAMRGRMVSIRDALVNGLRARGAPVDFSFIHAQRGMFSFSGLSDAQVAFLREKKAIYMVGGGRINVAGITTRNLDYLCDSVVEALRAAP
ncbi:MAG TPA: amino acid aminotransferase [Kiritimatiellia bacterium]|nr:amino acid aminotransferase [Kiritimatiellia bacterium]HRZ11159.1 amino acid aminotransferase [Kiritimatiellia bacterium]HSA19469.1 amino acid aminotransferase [Kiritimatiellia bacterium]